MYNKVSIRKFNEKDINNKIKWINDSDNNKFLHYDLPLEYSKTLNWYNNNKDNTNRYDAVIEFENIPVGLIGLLNIDKKNLKAEYYIVIGEKQYKGLGIAKKATLLLLEYAFNELKLNKIYLYTEIDNISAQKLFEKIGMSREGLLKSDLFYNNKFVDRYIYSISCEEYKNE